MEITETIPPGWSYDLWVDAECVTITDQGSDYWSATVDLGACGGSVSIRYDLYPPYEGPTGTYTVSGTFSTGTEAITLESRVVLCAQVDVEAAVYFYGYGWDELWLADPNGDDLVGYEWDFGNFGAASGQEPQGGPCMWGDCSFPFEGLTCRYDPEWEDWIWSYELPVSLTVTDEAGDSTTVEALIPLEGPCGWGW